MFKQAKRRFGDGQVRVERFPDGEIVVGVTNHGLESVAYMSEYNASRVFAGLALLLGIPLSKTAAKSIKVMEASTPTVEDSSVRYGIRRTERQSTQYTWIVDSGDRWTGSLKEATSLVEKFRANVPNVVWDVLPVTR